MKKKQSRTLSTASVNSSTTSASVTSTPVKDVDKEMNGNEKDAEPDEKLKLTEENKLQEEEESQQTAPPDPSSEKSTKSSKAKSDRCRDKSDFKSKKIEDDEVLEKKALPVCNGDSNTVEDVPVNQPSLDMSVCRLVHKCLFLLCCWCRFFGGVFVEVFLETFFTESVSNFPPPKTFGLKIFHY